jgi:hypothetical protein
MKIKENRLFPHPVLREENKDYESSVFNAIVSSKNLINKYIINLQLSLINEELLYLIKKRRAKIICHLECSKTKFREILDLNLGENELSIQAGLVDGIVYLLPLIVANEDIDNYYSKDFNKDYDKNSFKLEKGDILAIGKHFPILIENERGKLASVPSIFSIKEFDSPLQKGTEIGLTREKIEIYLPENVFKIYQKNRKKQFYNDVMSTIIILPSLIYVLDKLKEVEGSLLEYGDKRWFRVIIKKLKEEGIDFEKKDLSETNTFAVAQKIIEYLNSKAIESLISLEETEEKEE